MQPADLTLGNAHEAKHGHDQCVISWLCFSAQHPALPGHFPGRPIIPGVVILQSMHELLRQHWPQHTLCSLPAVKFLRPVQATEQLLLGIESATITSQDIHGRFVCRCGTRTVTHGSFVARVAAGKA